MKHKKLSRTFAILISVLVTTAAQAQNARTITLKEAVDLTLAHNKGLKADSAKITEARLAIDEANERRLPDASVTGAGMFLPINPGVDLKTGGNNSGNSSSPPRVHEAIYGIANVSWPVYTAGKLKYGIESAKYLEQAIKL